MKIAIGADHRGVNAGLGLVKQLSDEGHDVVVLHCRENEPCDYPDAAYTVARAVASGAADRGILLCGSGIGMSIAANKVHGVRAALANNTISAELSRRHNDANVLCMSADTLGAKAIRQVVEAWLGAEFEGGRHARRVEKIAAIERGEDPAAVTT
ncbi:MAG: ribose 5-phosphate isomerase B [Phycisphaeraceae bacterium]|nr:ribose 5-phosphate isomerase B [Phycisphaeraceae bacterium]MCB9847223.1 ribose 5-phosphate isomerase B [Phycisphaeraceae bacterium]